MKRFGKPEEVASVVALLASSDASYMPGVEIGEDAGAEQGPASRLSQFSLAEFRVMHDF